MRIIDHGIDRVPQYLKDAARVADFMQEEELGRWRLKHFTVTVEKHRVEVARAILTNRYGGEVNAHRAAPPGDYIHLLRRMTRKEMEDAFYDHFGMDYVTLARKRGEDPERRLMESIPEDTRYQPIMSDTPTEIAEHAHALLNARGRVLITGLGLGCLPHALLKKVCDQCGGDTGVIDFVATRNEYCPACGGTGLAVSSIDIIEIDQQVIRLTGKYLNDPRVTIHHGSADEPLSLLPMGSRFDYVWHDIWSHVACRNLRKETAEHGISYQCLFDLYGRCFDVGDTQAWAYEEAQAAHEALRAHEQEELAFQDAMRKTWETDRPAAAEMAYERALRSSIHGAPLEGSVPPEFRAIIDPHGELRAHTLKMVTADDFWERLASEAEHIAKNDPLGSPNDYMEA